MEVFGTIRFLGIHLQDFAVKRAEYADIRSGRRTFGVISPSAG